MPGGRVTIGLYVTDDFAGWAVYVDGAAVLLVDDLATAGSWAERMHAAVSA